MLQNSNARRRLPNKKTRLPSKMRRNYSARLRKYVMSLVTISIIHWAANLSVKRKNQNRMPKILIAVMKAKVATKMRRTRLKKTMSQMLRQR